jgi:hypothetical protein
MGVVVPSRKVSLSLSTIPPPFSALRPLRGPERGTLQPLIGDEAPLASPTTVSFHSSIISRDFAIRLNPGAGAGWGGSSGLGEVVQMPEVGGLHHLYEDE